MNILSVILQSVSVLIVVMSFVIAQNRAAKKRQADSLKAIQDKLAADLKDSESRLNDSLTKLSNALMAEQENRVANINRLHKRIDEMQKELISDLQHRMSRMEGDIQGMANILNLIHEWFINQAKTGR